ncbi:hypothetical protein F5884DRAFT_875146 [Xylogone sp. PMI_703]|nr:hypothetical protein F5884DRAFT_875146 [Xylogone sp. PMI_703]
MQVESKACCTRPLIILSGGYDNTTGSFTAKRGVFVVYDVFGLYIQSLRGADILASGCEATPDGTGEFQIFINFMNDPAYSPKIAPLIVPLMKAIQKVHLEIEAAGQCHPSLLDSEDVKRVTVLMVILPSMDEVPEAIEEWLRNLKRLPPESYLEALTDQVHGWMTSCADFNDLHKFEEYLRGYRIVRSFFARFL